MALATQCPHCKTIFRVAADQLKLRGGIVRCGACHEIFDGNASLVDLEAAAPAEAPPSAPAVADQPPAPTTVDAAAGAHLGEHAADTDPAEADSADAGIEDDPATATSNGGTGDDTGEVPVYALDLGAALGPLGILPKPEAEAEAEEHPAAEAAATDERTEAPAPDEEQPLPFEPPAEQVSTAEHDAASGEHQVLEEHLVSHAEPEQTAAVHDGRIEPTLARADEELLATVPHGEPDLDLGADGTAPHPAVQHPPLPKRESADSTAFAPPPPPLPPKSARARQLARRSRLTPTRIDDSPKLRVPEIDEPEFVKRGRQREQSGKRRLILMWAGSVVLLLALAAQAALIFRNDLAARIPATRPALAALCSLLRCRVELPARIDNLTIETGELQTLGPDTYVLATLLHNQGSAVQAWPDIELALTDANDKPLVRRVFAPADYLPKGAANGFAAHGEQAVKLYFQLDQLKPSGYHIAVFYP